MRSLVSVAAFIAATATGAAQEATLACSNAGASYQIGDLACIAACHEQRRLARCDLVSGAATWTYVSESCPSAMILNQPWPSDWSQIPAIAAMSPIPIKVNSSAIAAAIAPKIFARDG